MNPSDDTNVTNDSKVTICAGSLANDEAAMHEINRRLQGVLEAAPSDATVELEVMRYRGGYKGLIKVYSQQHRFVGAKRSPRFQELIDAIFHEVKSQIKEWKRTRFPSGQTADGMA